MSWNLAKELWRKSIHLAILVVLILYHLILQRFDKQMALLMLTAFLILLLVLEYVRLELGKKMPLLSLFIRSKESYRMYGAVYFMIASIITLAVFDFRIALAALLMATFGDIAAALIGKKYGTTLIYRSKTWAGCIAGFVVNSLVGFIVLTNAYDILIRTSITATNAYNIYIILGMAVTATLVETLADELDDNLLIPIFAGFAGQVIKLAF